MKKFISPFCLISALALIPYALAHAVPGAGPGGPSPHNHMPAAQMGNAVSQAVPQEGQAQAQKDAASAQASQATEQSMQQGISQTAQVSEQLRQNASSVGQDMQSMVNSTHE